MNKPLEIVEIFKSINGEGDEIGHRTVFVRTFGCSANCPGCDTSFAKGKKTKNVKNILAQEIVDFCKPYGIKHVTFTGGEPFEQPNIHLVIKYLIQQGMSVTVETNGIYKPREVCDYMHVVVSPKPWMLVDKNRDAYYYWSKMNATFKFAGAPADVDRIRKWFRILRLRKAYIQPWIDPKAVSVEELNKAYLDLMEVVHEKFKEGEDIRVVPQFHKYVWGNKRGV